MRMLVRRRRGVVAAATVAVVVAGAVAVSAQQQICGAGQIPFDSVCCGSGATYCPASGSVCLTDGTCIPKGSGNKRCGDSLVIESSQVCCTDTPSPYACESNQRCGAGQCLYGALPTATADALTRLLLPTQASATDGGGGTMAVAAEGTLPAQWVTGSMSCGTGVIANYFVESGVDCCASHNPAFNSFCDDRYNCSMDGTRCCFGCSKCCSCGKMCLECTPSGQQPLCCGDNTYGCDGAVSTCPPPGDPPGCLELDAVFTARSMSIAASISSSLASLASANPPRSPATPVGTVGRQLNVVPTTISAAAMARRRWLLRASEVPILTAVALVATALLAIIVL